LGAGLIAVFFGWHLQGVETRMDTRSFFEEDSDPDLADRFMAERFSGSVFLQVLIDGDMRNPDVLRQVADFQDRVGAVPGVSRIESITNVLGLVNEAFGGQRHVAADRKAVKYHGYLAETTDPAVRLLVDPMWTGALIQVAIGGFDSEVVRQVTRDIRNLARDHLPGGVVRVPATAELRAAVMADAAERMTLLTGTAVTTDELVKMLAGGSGESKELGAAIRTIVEREIGEEEMILVQDETDFGALASLITADFTSDRGSLADLRKRLVAVADEEELDAPEEFDKGVAYVHRALAKVASAQVGGRRMDALTAHFGPQPDRIRFRLAAIVSDVSGKTLAVPSRLVADASDIALMSAEVSGYPVVQEAMSQSVHSNQIKSVMTSLPLVFIILLIVFRNPFAGLIGMVPTVLTLLVTFGLMGLFSKRLPLDIGSSMLASIALGVGIDYSIHFLWRYRETGLADAMRTTGRAIVINAAEITAGFVVLAWATIVPMSNFGLLVAQTLLVAAFATLVLMPALIGWWKPDRPDGRKHVDAP
ncbi:MAG: putative RND superfamily exporter protein, partial [Myxococcota bacterium]